MLQMKDYTNDKVLDRLVDAFYNVRDLANDENKEIGCTKQQLEDAISNNDIKELEKIDNLIENCRASLEPQIMPSGYLKQKGGRI